MTFFLLSYIISINFIDEGTAAVSTGNDRPCTVHVAEWIYSRVNPGKNPEIVPGIVLDWPVPTVQRLWFG